MKCRDYGDTWEIPTIRFTCTSAALRNDVSVLILKVSFMTGHELTFTNEDF